MSGDYKYDAQIRAEEMAEEIYGKDFFELNDQTRMALYGKALRDNAESLMDRADFIRKSEREKC
jgi:hypothetical protein